MANQEVAKDHIVSLGKRKLSLDEFIRSLFDKRTEYQVNTASIELLDQSSKKKFPPITIADHLDNTFVTESGDVKSEEKMDKTLVRIILLLRVVSFLQGQAAVRPSIVMFLVNILNGSVFPDLPSATLANDKQIMSALYYAFTKDSAFAKQYIATGNQIPDFNANEVKRFTMGVIPTQAYYIYSAYLARNASKLFDIATGFTCEASGAYTEPFQQIYYDISHPYQTAIDVASIYRWLLSGSSSVNKVSSSKEQNIEEIRQAPLVSASLRDISLIAGKNARIEINSTDAPGSQKDWQHDPALHSAYIMSSNSALCTATIQALNYSFARIKLLLDNAEAFGPITFNDSEASLNTLRCMFSNLQKQFSTPAYNNALSPLTFAYQCNTIVQLLWNTAAFEAFVGIQLTTMKDIQTYEQSEKAINEKNQKAASMNEGKMPKDSKKPVKSKVPRGLIFGQGISFFRSYLERSSLIGTKQPLFDNETTISSSYDMFNTIISPVSEEAIHELETALTAVNQMFVPKLPKGTRDCDPELMAIREKVFDIITNIFKKHGGVGIDTPVFERKETLTGKYGEDSKLIYDLADQGGEILSLRYDLTVPFARYCATHGITNIKRYHIAKVYRRDQPALTKGRFREFYQCDLDIAGNYPSMVADAEVIKVMSEILSSIDIGKFKIKLNHRKLLDAIMIAANVPTEKLRPICSAIDKLDKESWENVKKEMCFEKGLPEEVADCLGKYVNPIVNANISSRELLQTLRQDLQLSTKEQSRILSQEAFEDISSLFDYLEAMNCMDYVSFDLSLARGLDYYTGIIYEAILLTTTTDERGGEISVGSIAAGGRYDNLIGMFSTKQVPAVGVSIGIERIFAILEAKRSKEESIKTTKTLVLVASADNQVTFADKMKLASELWTENIPTEYLYVKNPSSRKQIEFAFENQIPFIVWIGENELKNNTFTLKQLVKDKSQAIEDITYDRKQLIEVLQEAISKLD